MAQTLKFGNGNFATKAGSTLCYDDQNGNFKPIPMDFTRASTATRVNKEGLIEVVKSNVPRIDYTDTSDGVLLLEDEATNLVKNSYLLDTFGFGRSTRTLVDEINPDGTTQSVLMSATSGTSGTHRAYSDDMSVTSGTEYTISIYIKKGTSAKLEMTLLSNVENGIGFGNMIIDLDNMNPDNGILENFNNDWYRAQLKGTVNSTTTAKMFLYVYNETGDRTYTADGSENIHLFGAQVESNSFATSLIKTGNDIVTRVAETASGAGNSEVFNDSEGVLMFEGSFLSKTSSPNQRIAISDGTTSNRILIQNVGSSSNRLQFYTIVNNATSTDFYTDLSDITLFNKIVFKYKINNFSVWINGFEVLTDTSGITFPNGTLTELAFDGGDGSNDFYGKTKELGYYNTILTDLELETLTSYRSWESMVNELNLNIIYNG